MPSFETYASRLGEHVVQALIERIERYEGIKSNPEISLEERWMNVMQENSLSFNLAA